MSRSVNPIGTPVMVPGRRYKALHGGTFECLEVSCEGRVKLRSVASGATFLVAGITEYDDGSITWRNAEDLHYTSQGGERK